MGTLVVVESSFSEILRCAFCDTNKPDTGWLFRERDNAPMCADSAECIERSLRHVATARYPARGYTGMRVGDEVTLNGVRVRCVALTRDEDHTCERGELCSAAWEPILKALPIR